MGVKRVVDLDIGMVLAEDVNDANGRFLLGMECVLEARHIRALQAWGVISVTILNTDEDEESKDSIAEVTVETLNKAESELRELFKFNNLEHEFMQELFKEAVARKAIMLTEDTDEKET